MMVVNRYATAESRVGLVYRLLAASRDGRRLVVSGQFRSNSDEPAAWVAGELHSIDAMEQSTLDADQEPLGEVPSGSAGSVFLHRSAQALRGHVAWRGRCRLPELLPEVARVLEPGGVVIGSVSNRQNPRGDKNRCGSATPDECVKYLSEAGFDRPEVYLVLPSIEFPEAIVSAKPLAARWHLRNTLRRYRHEMRLWQWLPRWLAIETGIMQRIQPDLVFRGRKRCST